MLSDGVAVGESKGVLDGVVALLVAGVLVLARTAQHGAVTGGRPSLGSPSFRSKPLNPPGFVFSS